MAETTTTTNQLPDWLNSAGQKAVDKANALTYTPYTGERVAGTTGAQNQAYSGISNLASANGTANTAGQAQSMFTNYANAPKSTVAPIYVEGYKVNDESGPLGTIASYMNPYTSSVLTPTLQSIYDASGKQRNTIGASATASGAFGDARQGVLESTLGKNTMSAVGNATNSAYSDAYNQAMGLRTSDANRMLSADTTSADRDLTAQTTNATLNETALQRLLSGGQAIQASGTQEQTDALSRLSALLASGTAQQQQQQNVDDASLAAHNEAQQAQYDQLAALVSTLSGTPTTSTSTSEAKNSNSTLSTIASIVGALF